MDKRKLESNIEKLRKMIPKKPIHYTDDYPKTIAESLTKYLRSSTIWNIQASSYIYEKEGWPLPFYVNPNNIKIGYLNELMFVKFGIYDWIYYNLYLTLVYDRQGPYPIKPRFVHKIYLAFKKKKKLVYYDWFNATLLCNFFR